jgi:hypothetical protein
VAGVRLPPQAVVANALREQLVASGRDPVGPPAERDALLAACVDAVGWELDHRDPPTLAPAALSAAVRGLAAALVARAPGRAVELRIPGPLGLAVQCVPGPRHTRGTPPNVVETDPVSWVRLATGRLGWAEAVAAGQVSASGLRADLSAYLPLTGAARG